MHIAKNGEICYNHSIKRIKGLEWDIVSIVEYYKNKKNKNKMIQNIEIPTFDREKFWFLRKMPRNILNFGPFVQSVKSKTAGYNIDTRYVIGHTMYGKYYKGTQQSPVVFGKNGIEKLWKGVRNKHEIVEHINYHKDNGKVLSLLDKGITFERLLGKEWDNDLSRSVVQQMQLKTQKYNGYYSRMEDAKRGLVASKELRMTPNDAIRYMQWERLVKDPSIINSLLTRKQAEQKGYKFDDNNMPISVLTNNDNEPLYDVTGMYDVDKMVPNFTMTSTINDILKDVTPASLYVFGNQLAKATKVRVSATKELLISEIVVKTRWLGSVVKKAKNLAIRTLGRTESAVNKAVSIEVSTEGTQAEKTYLLVRDIVGQSINPLIRETEKACVLYGETTKDDDAYIRFLSRFKLDTKPDNLPTYKEFKENEWIIENAAISLIASQVVKMGNLREKESRALSELYKVDAMQILSQVEDKDNTWMMPLIASYVCMTLPKFAKDLRTDINKYADLNDIRSSNSLTEAVFGIVDWNPANGILTRNQSRPRIDVSVFDAVNEEYKPQFNVKNILTAFRERKLSLTDQMNNSYAEIQEMMKSILGIVKEMPLMGAVTDEQLGNIKNGLAAYKQLKSKIEDYKCGAEQYSKEYGKTQSLPRIGAFDEALLEYNVEVLRLNNADIQDRMSNYRMMKFEYSSIQLLKVARAEVFEVLSNYGIDASEVTNLDSVIQDLEEQGKDVTRLEYINNIMTNDLHFVNLMDSFEGINFDVTEEQLLNEYNEIFPLEEEVFNMTNLWKEWLVTVETEQQANEILRKMDVWQDDLLTLLEKTEEYENEYSVIREQVLPQGNLNAEEVEKYKAMIENIDISRVKACYHLNESKVFAKFVQTSPTISNDKLWTTTKEVDSTRKVLTNWKNKCRMLLDEVTFVSAIGTELEDDCKKRYASSFDNYIKYLKSLETSMEDLNSQDCFKDLVDEEIKIFRNIYNRSVESESTEEELQQIAQFYKEQFGEDVEDKKQLPTAKEVSALKRKLRLGMIDKREYYQGLCGVKDTMGTAIAKIEQAHIDAQNVSKNVKKVQLTEDIKTAVLHKNVVENIIKNKAIEKEENTQKAVQQIKQAVVSKNVVQKVINDNQKIPALLTKEQLTKLREDLVKEDTAIVYGVEKLGPGYVIGKAKKFSLGQYSKDRAELLKQVVPGELPEFVDGESLYKHKEVFEESMENVSNTDFISEILKKANKTIAKSLKKEYNVKVHEIEKSIAMSKDYNDLAMTYLNNRQDICGNILHHFVARKQATQKVMDKGMDYNPRFVAQLGASKSLRFTAEQITNKVLTFYNKNYELLKDVNSTMVYDLYVRSVGSNNLDKAIRGEVVNPMVNAIHQESRQLI